MNSAIRFRPSVRILLVVLAAGFCRGPGQCRAYVMCATDEDCDDGSFCTNDTCDASGIEPVCVHEYNTLACNDENPCTAEDSCRNGMCKGDPVYKKGCNIPERVVVRTWIFVVIVSMLAFLVCLVGILFAMTIFSPSREKAY